MEILVFLSGLVMALAIVLGFPGKVINNSLEGMFQHSKQVSSEYIRQHYLQHCRKHRYK